MVLVQHHANIILSKVLLVIVRQLRCFSKQIHLIMRNENVAKKDGIVVDVGATKIQEPCERKIRTATNNKEIRNVVFVFVQFLDVSAFDHTHKQFHREP